MNHRLVFAVLTLSLAPLGAFADSFQPGEILLDNAQGNNVQRYSSTGTLLQTYTGTGTFWEGASLTPGGNLVTGFSNPSGGIDIFSPDGTQLISFATAGSALHADVSVFANGTLAFDDQLNNNVQLFSQAGASLGTVSLPGLSGPVGSTVGTDNILYVAGTASSNLAKVNQSGAFLGTISLGFQPGDLVMSPLDGTLWVSGAVNGLVEHITTLGGVIGSFSTGLSGTFVGIGLAPDSNSLYVTTETSTVIRHLSLTGTQLGDFNISSPGNAPVNLTVVPFPEPSSALLLAVSGAGLLVRRRR